MPKNTAKIVRTTINFSRQSFDKLMEEAAAASLSFSAYINQLCGVQPLSVGRPRKEKPTK